MEQIPTSTDALFWSQTTTLDGVSYLLEFRYNTRESCYYLQISQPDGTVLVQGIKLVTNFRLLRRRIDTRLPPGDIVAVAYDGSPAPAALGELGIGQRVELVYLTAEETAAEGWNANRSAIPGGV